GYDRADFKDAWTRYLPPFRNVTASQPAPDMGFSENRAVTIAVTRDVTEPSQTVRGNAVTDETSSVTDDVTADVTDQNTAKPAPVLDCDGVTDQKGSSREEEQTEQDIIAELLAGWEAMREAESPQESG